MRNFTSLRPIPLATGLALGLLLAGATSALARPKIRESFFTAYPTAVGTRLDNVPSNPGHCGVCHYDFNGGGTRNPFGSRLESAGIGSCTTVACRTAIILGAANEDADADGYTQNTEITAGAPYTNTPTFPGLTPGNVNNVTNVTVSEIQGYLVPTTGSDTQSPVVTVSAPNGGENWTGGTQHNVTYAATDNVGVVAVDVFYRDGETAAWRPLARNVANTGLFLWFVQNTPGATTRVRVVARDAAGNQGEDVSNGLFTITQTPGGVVPTTLRDFELPGTQPLGGGTFDGPNLCVNCHGGYDPAVEPGHNFKGMMMGQSARDPLFFACLAVAEQDAPSSGDLCLKCHSPFGWLGGRSQPTSGGQLTAFDREGMACDFCHRAVDPVYKPGVSPVEDQAIIDGLMPGHQPAGYSNGQYVIDPLPRKRGPFADPVAPHAFLASPFHSSSDFCGTCHDVSNPAFDRVGVTADYVPGPLDAPATSISSATLMALERTYSEWKNSAFPAGVYAPEFAGNKPDGVVAKCQDCHLRDVNGKGCNDVAAPVRPDLPLHDMMGGNAWLGPVIATLYPSETDAAALADGASRATSMLQKAALVDVTLTPAGSSWLANVTVTNRCGHKLPSGYPEGRRLWLDVLAYDPSGQKLYESGAYDPTTGVLTEDADAVVYETQLGISPPLANALGLPHGKSFHFALNDTIFKDNRIPPAGFANAAFDAFGGKPVDESRPAPRYADGQNWDVSTFTVPGPTAKVVARLYYQTTSKEYVEFLRDMNTSNPAGQTMFDAWNTHGKSPPVLVAADSAFSTVGVGDEPVVERTRLEAGRNPFVGTLELRLAVARPAPIELAIYDARGRQVYRRSVGSLGGGAHRLLWDGKDERGRDSGAGVFWAQVRVGSESLRLKVVRLR
jgi:hypothetical protein